jgi:hypothetical protein
MTHPVITAEHAGINRVVTGVAALRSVARGGASTTSVYRALTFIGVALAITSASRALDGATIGFVAEGLALATAAFAAFAMMIIIVVPTARVGMRALRKLETHLANKRADQQFWETAMHDPRVMAEYRAAYARQTSE